MTMSERMIPIPFEQLMTWMATEYQREGSVFGVYRIVLGVLVLGYFLIAG